MKAPKLARVLLRTLLPDDMGETMEGDLLEGFERVMGEGGRARAWFWKEVLLVPYLSIWRRNRRVRESRGGWISIERGKVGMDGTMTDLKVAVRALRSRPGFALTAVTTLAATIGALTLLFSVLRGVLLRPLPYDDPASLASVFVLNHPVREGEGAFTYWDRWPIALRLVSAWREAPGPVEQIGVYQQFGPSSVRIGEVTQSFSGARVDEGMFSTLGVAPALGRVPSTEEFLRSATVAVIHDRMWRDYFGANPGVLGQTFVEGEVTYEVIGVMPPDFFFPDDDQMIWTPLIPLLREAGWERPLFQGVARVAAGVPIEDAGRSLDQTSIRLAEETPALEGQGARAVGYREELFRDANAGLGLLIGTTALVLLMACVNLANGLLARGLERRRELAVRAALGQGRGALVRTALSEAAVLSVAGGVVGVAAALSLLDPFVRALESTLGGLPRSEAITIDVPVLLFTLAAITITALGAGLGPALVAARRAPGDAITSSRGSRTSRGVARSQRGLLVLQAALVMVLLIGTGLLLRSFARMSAVDPGYETSGIAWLDIEVDEMGATEADGGDATPSLASLLERVRTIPGVTHTSAVGSIPGQGGVPLIAVRETFDDPVDQSALAAFGSAEASYFEAMGIPMLFGRTFDPTSTSSSVVIDEILARQLFGTENAVGRTFFPGTDDDSSELTVIGVTAAIRQVSPIMAPRPQFIRPLSPAAGRSFYLVAHTESEATALPLIREAADAQPLLTVAGVGTLEQTLAGALRPARLRLWLVGGLTGLALLLALLGTFGVVNHQVMSARRDIGIRAALGAGRQQEVGRVVARALAPIALGAALGGAGGLALSRVLIGVLYELPATDPVAYAGAAVLVLAVGFFASWVPARRVMAVDPMEVLNEA